MGGLIQLLRRLLGRYGAPLLVVILGGFLFAWSGVYNVAASRDHWDATTWLLQFALRSSVRTHSLGTAVPSLDDAALVQRGAGYFEGGCSPCHGAPGEAASPIVEQMLPQPPGLAASASRWRSRELFFIVKHGFKYTGTPGWAATERDDEVWAMVAFLSKLPGLNGQEYRRLAYGELPDTDHGSAELARFGPLQGSLAACSRCHGLNGAGPANGAYPRLNGLSEAYLLQALEAYSTGRRPSGIMQPAAAALDAGARQALARFYAEARPQAESSGSGSDHPDLVRQGEVIALRGVPEQNVPACAACHGPTRFVREPLYPSLSGQYARYIRDQLALWRRGLRDGTPLARIMAPIGQRLGENDARAVAAYYASRAPRSDVPPARTTQE